MKKSNVNVIFALFFCVFGIFLLKPALAEQELDIYAPVSYMPGAEAADTVLRAVEILMGRLEEVTGVKLGFHLVHVSEEGLHQLVPGCANLQYCGTWVKEDLYEFIRRGLDEKTIDFLLVDADTYMGLKAKKIQVKPYLTATLNGKAVIEQCLYARKADGVKKLEELRGKKISGKRFDVLRKLFIEKGINEQLGDFFDYPAEKFNVEFEPYWAEQMLDDTIDAFFGNSMPFLLYQYVDPEVTKAITPISCMEIEPMWILLARSGIDDATLGKVKNFVVSAHNDEVYKKNYKFYIDAMKIRIVPADGGWSAAFSKYEKFLNEAEKQGWDRDELTQRKLGE